VCGSDIMLNSTSHSTNDKTQHQVQHKNAERLNENYHNTTLGRGAQRKHLAKSKTDHYI
jgi:hypothetical protein